ncbi:methyl-accepting chemotaxis protein [Quadrisphaera oryzae]|uniref:methyl-accepting chemotaxis protein n=1 Tax=Quadrisphaera TaxID=317661 RepID=UPI00198CC852|nr:methyl-accepting chemotaxis protein [Quadrisphaera sp. RL12-1S]
MSTSSPGPRLRTSRWTVRTRLLAVTVTLAVAVLGMGGVGVVQVLDVNSRAQEVRTAGTLPLERLGTLNADWQTYLTNNARAFVAGLTPEQQTQFKQITQKSLDQVGKDLDGMAGVPLTPAAEDSIKTVSTTMVSYRDVIAKVVTGLETGDTAALAKVIPQALEHEAEIQKAISAALAAQSTAAAAAAAQAQAASDAAVRILAVIALAALVASVTLALVVTRSITRPLDRVRGVLAAVAAGDLRARAGISGRDELASVSDSLDQTLEGFGRAMAVVIATTGQLTGTSRVLDQLAADVAAKADEAAAQADVVSAAALTVSGSVDTVAAGSGEMQTAIGEISASAAEAAAVAAQAVEAVEDTTTTVARLGASSQEIASVVKLITSIAEQTNLLALNATIEAARAGEAGKGFAVVAGEVKELARQTAQATEDISRRVSAIQGDTDGAVSAIERISEVISRINDHQTTIAAAVEEQSATSREMTRNVADAASGAQEIAANTSALAAGAEGSRGRAAETRSASAELTALGAQLQEAVAGFTV